MVCSFESSFLPNPLISAMADVCILRPSLFHEVLYLMALFLCLLIACRSFLEDPKDGINLS